MQQFRSKIPAGRNNSAKAAALLSFCLQEKKHPEDAFFHWRPGQESNPH
jgi:hypothetical protein